MPQLFPFCPQAASSWCSLHSSGVTCFPCLQHGCWCPGSTGGCSSLCSSNGSCQVKREQVWREPDRREPVSQVSTGYWAAAAVGAKGTRGGEERSPRPIYLIIGLFQQQVPEPIVFGNLLRGWERQRPTCHIQVWGGAADTWEDHHHCCQLHWCDHHAADCFWQRRPGPWLSELGFLQQRYVPCDSCSVAFLLWKFSASGS